VPDRGDREGLQRFTSDEAGLLAAAEALRRGGIVAYPTETQYGLGASAFDGAALERLAELKGRTAGPFLLVTASADEAWTLAAEVPEAAVTIAARCWPGPVTLLLPARSGLPAAVTGPEGTVAVRVPGERVARELPAVAGFPITSTSANPAGREPLTDPGDIGRTFPHGLAGIVRGPVLAPGPPSTIVDSRSLPLRVVREGAVSRNSLARLTGLPVEGGEAIPLVLFVCTGNTCRSPMAEGAFLTQLRQRGLEGRIDAASAGVAAVNWGSAVTEAQEVAWEEGIDISAHRPRQITPQMTQEADIIVVMTEGQRQRVALLNPMAADRTHLLRRIGAELAGRQPLGSRDLEDPIGRPLAAYRKTLKTIRGELEKGFDRIVEQASERRRQVAAQRVTENETGPPDAGAAGMEDNTA